MKECTRCGEDKELENFHKTKRSSDGHKSQCKQCVGNYYNGNKDTIRKKQNEWYEANREHRIKYIRKYRLDRPEKFPNVTGNTRDCSSSNVRRASRKEFCVSYKGGSCEDCGLTTKHYSVYDFHHTDPSTKSFGIAGRGRGVKMETLKEELDKCVMICANCHRIRHHENKEEQ